jgi:DNA topoisomerase-3
LAGDSSKSSAAATGAGAEGDSATGCGFSISKIPGGRTFEAAEVEQLIENKKIGPLEGFRSKAGWPFTAEIALKFSEEEKLEAGIRFR